MPSHTRWSLAVPLVFLSACGGGGAPTTPSLPQGVSTPAPAPPPPMPVATPAPVAMEETPEATPNVVRMASMRGANGHSVSGTARIVRRGGGYSLELGADFRIDSGRNDVYLARSAGSRDGGLNLGDLKSTTGAQSYDLGSDDGSRYGFVLLWCRPFAVPIGVGDLR